MGDKIQAEVLMDMINKYNAGHTGQIPCVDKSEAEVVILTIRKNASI